MNIINHIFQWVGVVCCLGIVASIITFACGFLLGEFRTLIEVRSNEVRKDKARDIGLNICHAADWFSEDESTMNALKFLGQSLSERGDFNTNMLREQWRSSLKRGSTPS